MNESKAMRYLKLDNFEACDEWMKMVAMRYLKLDNFEACDEWMKMVDGNYPYYGEVGHNDGAILDPEKYPCIVAWFIDTDRKILQYVYIYKEDF